MRKLVAALVAVAAVILLIVAFVIWRRVAVSRGYRKRDERLYAELREIDEKLSAGALIGRDVIAEKAKRPELRLFLYSMLKFFEKLELFPEEFLSLEEQARSDLAYWLCHPCELGDAPDEIELIHRSDKQVDGLDVVYFVLKFRKLAPHWSAEGGWRLGVAGPYVKPFVPYSGAPAFSRFERLEGGKPEDEVEWWHQTMLRAAKK
jgi:hypothetical protein